jgi:hypothetical protein
MIAPAETKNKIDRFSAFGHSRAGYKLGSLARRLSFDGAAF